MDELLLICDIKKNIGVFLKAFDKKAFIVDYSIPSFFSKEKQSLFERPYGGKMRNYASRAGDKHLILRETT